MAKASQLDRAIQKLRDEINVLEAAITRLEAEKALTPKRPKPAAPPTGT